MGMTNTHKFEILKLTLYTTTSEADFDTWNRLIQINLSELYHWLEQHAINYNIDIDDIETKTYALCGTIHLLIPDRKHAAYFKLVWHNIYPKVLRIHIPTF
jgi:NADH:ubiquinone oxidoreductase subunit 4 (subunit M)